MFAFNVEKRTGGLYENIAAQIDLLKEFYMDSIGAIKDGIQVPYDEGWEEIALDTNVLNKMNGLLRREGEDGDKRLKNALRFFAPRWLPRDFGDLEKIAWAQHYDIPTYMLDFFFDPLVALYFAASGATKHVVKSFKNADYDFMNDVMLFGP